MFSNESSLPPKVDVSKDFKNSGTVVTRECYGTEYHK